MNAPGSPPHESGRARVVLLAILAALAIGVVLLARPLAPPDLPPNPDPAADFDEALIRLTVLGTNDSCALNPECRTHVLSHGGRTSRVIVLFHGITNCSAQFDSLGWLLYERGANVVIPTLPHHGCADRMTDALAHLNAPEMVEFTDRVVDDAVALGDSVTVVGLSAGAVMAAWAGEKRSEVDRAVVIAPLLAPAGMPDGLVHAFTRLCLALPNQFAWWDDKAREKLAGPRYVYPRWASRGMGQTLWLGATVRESARRARPAAREMVLVTIGGDPAVNNAVNVSLANDWRAHGARTTRYEFPVALELPHDLIDPHQPKARPGIVYPELVRLILPVGGD